MLLIFFSHWYPVWYCRKSLFLCICFTDFRDYHDGSWFMEMEQHPSVLVVYQWLNGYGKIRRAPAGCRPSVRLPILEYHDLTLSRFSRYVWEAAHRPGAAQWAGAGTRVSGLCSLCLYAHILQSPGGRAGPGAHGTPNLCRYLTLCCVQKSEEIKMTKSAPNRAEQSGQCGNRPISSGAAIGRQMAGLWPNSDRGSWNVKMVDGRPSGPRDSVFAASLVDCVWKLLCLPVTGECWGHEAATGPSLLSTRSAQYRERQPVSVELWLSPEQVWVSTLSHLSPQNPQKHTNPPVTLRGPDWTQRFPVSRKTRLILDLEDYNYVVSLLGCNNPRHWVLTRHHPISNTSSNKLKLGCSRFLPKTPDKWHSAGSWKHKTRDTWCSPHMARCGWGGPCVARARGHQDAWRHGARVMTRDTGPPELWRVPVSHHNFSSHAPLSHPSLCKN